MEKQPSLDLKATGKKRRDAVREEDRRLCRWWIWT
jgi:hypothetical protein